MFAPLRNLSNQRARRRLSRRRFLCPNCLRFGKYKLACGTCWLKVGDGLVQGGGPCPRCRKPLSPDGVRARCQQCECAGDSAAYHQLPLRVLAALRASDFDSLCRAEGVPQGQGQGGLGHAFDTGDGLAYVLNLVPLIDAAGTLPVPPVFQEIDSIWVDAAEGDTQAHALSLMEAADHFVRRTNLTVAARRAMTVCVSRGTSEPMIDHVMGTRFGKIKYVTAATDFLCEGSKAGAEALGRIGDKPELPAHVNALKDKDRSVRYWAAEALGKIGGAAVPALIDALEDKDKDVRHRAALALWQIGDKASAYAFIDALKDSETSVRHCSAAALGQLGDKAAVPALTDLLRDSEESVRADAAEALGKIRDSAAVPALIDVLRNREKSAPQGAPFASSGGSPLLNYYIPDWRRRAASALGQIGDAAAIPALVEALNDSDVNLRRNSAEALGQIGDKAAVPALVDALADREQSVRGDAAQALGAIGDKASVPALLSFKDSNPVVSGRAQSALERIGGEVPAPALIEALKDSDEAIRRWAAAALERRGGAAVPALLDALKDSDPSVRTGAAWVLRGISNKQNTYQLIGYPKDVGSPYYRATWTPGKISKAAIPALIDALNDSERLVRANAVHILGVLGDEAAVPGLIDALRDKDSGVYISAAAALAEIGGAAVPALVDVLNDKEGKVRYYAVGALAKIGDVSTVPTFIDALKDSYNRVRRVAAFALKKIGDRSTVPVFIEALKDDDYQVRADSAKALGEIGDKIAMVPLIDMLVDSDILVRGCAASALGQLGERAALPALKAAHREQDHKSYWANRDCAFCEAVKMLGG